MSADKPSRIRWILVGWLALIGAVSYVDRVNLAIAAPSIAREFHLSNMQLGLVFSAFNIGYGLCQLPGGWTADRLGPRKVLTFSALWWALFTSLTASIPTGIVLAALTFWSARFLLGVGESVMYPSTNRWIAGWIPAGERGLANGVIFAGVGIGAAITPPIIASVITKFGWRASFHFCALAGVLGGLVWLWLSRDSPETHPHVNQAEVEIIARGIQGGGISRRPRLAWRAILRNRSVWGLTISYFCYGYVAFIFFTWFYIYLNTVRKVDVKTSSYYAMLPFIAMACCSAAGGLISDAVCRRFGLRWGRCGVAIVALFAAAIFVALGATAESARSASIVLAGGAGALYLSQSSYWSVSADLGGASAGSLSGLMNMGAQAGSAITAALTPVIADRIGWTSSFMVAAGFCVLGALAWLLVDPHQTLSLQTGNSSCGKSTLSATQQTDTGE
jgi:MFS transporter, ACS family, glucarate transporter